MTTHLPSYEGVLDAARQIDGVAVRTPLIESPALNAVVGGRVLMKAENLQIAGAFKFRGAYNRISRLNAEEKRRGVVAFSSGNHAQGVAAAAALVGTPAIIVMPSDSPKVKVEGVIGFGGEVRLYDRWTESREEIGAAIAAERGCVLVPPFDDPFIIEGQGTTALEMMDQADAPMDQLLCGASGGGLMAGINLVMAERSPETRVLVVEPDAYDDTARSLAARSWRCAARASSFRTRVGCSASLAHRIRSRRLTRAASSCSASLRHRRAGRLARFLCACSTTTPCTAAWSRTRIASSPLYTACTRWRVCGTAARW